MYYTIGNFIACFCCINVYIRVIIDYIVTINFKQERSNADNRNKTIGKNFGMFFHIFS